MKVNRKKFFDGFKKNFDSSLDQAQVGGIEFLLTSFENEPLWKDVRHIAYALATIYHETAASMLPVEEGYYLGRRAKAFQKTLRYYPHYGRGYVQLTWERNYVKAGKALGVDFVKSPNLVMRPDYSFQILTRGMFEGWFTGKKLSTYIHGSVCDYVGARKIINGTDKAGLIAGYARLFEKLLKDSGLSQSPAVQTASKTSPTDELQNSEAPTPTEGTIETTKIDGQAVIEKTTDTPGTVELPPQEDYKGIGLFAVLKKDITAVGGGNLSFQSLQVYAEQASGWPPWIISLITKVATIAIVLGIAWLVFRFAHYVVWKVGGCSQKDTSDDKR